MKIPTQGYQRNNKLKVATQINGRRGERVEGERSISVSMDSNITILKPLLPWMVLLFIAPPNSFNWMVQLSVSWIVHAKKWSSCNCIKLIRDRLKALSLSLSVFFSVFSAPFASLSLASLIFILWGIVVKQVKVCIATNQTCI